jgi:hypothetical protein
LMVFTLCVTFKKEEYEWQVPSHSVPSPHVPYRAAMGL